jgi:hypothetical protein
MWNCHFAALVLLAVAPGVRAELKLQNIEPRTHPLSPPRPESGYCPGETVIYSFDIVGLKETPDHSFRLEIAGKLLDAHGKEVFSFTSPIQGNPQLGLRSLRGNAVMGLSAAQAAGAYTLRVTIKDLVCSVEATFERRVRVTPPEFKLMSAAFSADEAGQVPVAALVQVGQVVRLNATYIGFGMSEAGAKISMRAWVTDAETKETLFSNADVTVEVPKAAQGEALQTIHFRLPVGATRDGRFVIHLRATDLVSQKTVESDVPLKVLPSE